MNLEAAAFYSFFGQFSHRTVDRHSDYIVESEHRVLIIDNRLTLKKIRYDRHRIQCSCKDGGYRDTIMAVLYFCCVTIICNFVCIKQQNRLSLILAQRMSKYQKIIDNCEPRTIFKAPPIWDCRIELLQRSVARLRPLSLGQNDDYKDNNVKQQSENLL